MEMQNSEIKDKQVMQNFYLNNLILILLPIFPAKKTPSANKAFSSSENLMIHQKKFFSVEGRLNEKETYDPTWLKGIVAFDSNFFQNRKGKQYKEIKC